MSEELRAALGKIANSGRASHPILEAFEMSEIAAAALRASTDAAPVDWGSPPDPDGHMHKGNSVVDALDMMVKHWVQGTQPSDDEGWQATSALMAYRRGNPAGYLINGRWTPASGMWAKKLRPSDIVSPLYAHPPVAAAGEGARSVASGDVLDLDTARLALFNAIRAIKIGNATDDKLILDNLRKAGFWVCRLGSFGSTIDNVSRQFATVTAEPPVAPTRAEPAQAIAIGKALDAKDGGYPAPGGPVGLREALKDLAKGVFIDAATKVHFSWINGTNGSEPDFGEAASDYAESFADAYVDNITAALSTLTRTDEAGTEGEG